MSALARGAGVAVALLVTPAIVAGSHVSFGGAGEIAVLRVAWSARPERIERCRRLSEAEIAALTVHMRREMECEGAAARYRLEVMRNDVLVDSATVLGGGLRNDRELYVSREIVVAPGEQAIRVRFARLDSSSVPADDEHRPDENDSQPAQTREFGDRAGREADERRRRRAEAIPAVLTVDTTLALNSRQVILVTYDPLARRLVIKDAP